MLVLLFLLELGKTTLRQTNTSQLIKPCVPPPE